MTCGRDQVDDDADASLLGLVSELDEVPEVTVDGIDLVKIAYVVAIFPTRRLLKRVQPKARDAEARQVIEPAHQALEVSDTVAESMNVPR